MSTPPASTIGFDAKPDRHPAVTLVLFVVVVGVSVSIVVGFKELGLRVVQWYGDSTDASAASASPAVGTTFVYRRRICARRCGTRVVGSPSLAAPGRPGSDRRNRQRRGSGHLPACHPAAPAPG